MERENMKRLENGGAILNQKELDDYERLLDAFAALEQKTTFETEVEP